MGHGAQKLFGLFGGHGIEGTGGMMESLGIRPARAAGVAAGIGEFGGGLLLALGFLTPLAAVLIVATMLTAILTAHRGKGIWNTNGGAELPLTFATVALGLAFNGAGTWSLDHAVGLHDAGFWWGIGAFVLAVAGSLGVIELSRHAQREPFSGAPHPT
jgi:putative oxidoreductase